MTFDITTITVPTNPGIYLMKDSSEKIIYIGKAKNLKKRVKSYFLKNQNYKTQKLVENISDIEFILTDNESEAFLLESNMIKKHRPRFNIELKDQQRYTYLRISDEKHPRLLVARRTRDGKFLGKGKTFGPFTQGSSKLLTIGTLRKAFQIRICKTLPKRVCLEYHLGNCEGPCEFKDAEERYPKHVAALEQVLKGKNQSKIFAKKLQEEMHQAANLQQFERAKDIRDTLIRLGSLQTKQNMEYVKNSDEEYFGIGIKEQIAIVMNFRMVNGVIRDSGKFYFDLVGDNSFSNFLYQYYSTHKIPKFIFVSVLPDNQKLLESLLSEQAGFTVKILSPYKGKKRDIINLILKNIELIHLKGGEPGLVELKEILNLPVIPNIIECFDISNHGTDFAVGAMSRFVGGAPHKSGYRKFRIKTVSGQNDFAMIGEIIKRRYYRLLEENSVLPDLIVIDGGKGQLNAALKSLESLGLKLPCVSLAKENEEIFVPKNKNSILIPKSKPSLKILQHARDEVHRFGVTYNRTIQKNQIK
ncbi:MAG TPA: excinuclease ABC subunit UvrC [Nitrosopumilus sp.]|nr:excinuclease ABC subunit UvrC [Thermoproteota archaeon]HJJ23059.1 excinuclease ABC subunit UvrC [Nitrosopumilus sp.]